MEKYNITHNELSKYVENNEKAMQMLIQVSKNQNECVKKIAKDERFEILTDVKKNLDKLAKENKTLTRKYRDLKENQDKMNVQLALYDRLVNTVGFTGQDVEIAKAVRNKCFKFVKNKDSDLYILFYGTYSSSLYSDLKNEMQVRRYSMIHTTKLNDALKYIQKWQPSNSIKVKRIQKLNDLNSKGKLNDTPSKARTQLALENYMNRTNGGVTRYAIQ